jgi:hypothetical protein
MNDEQSPIQWEGEDIGDALAEKLASDAWPGVFSGGKQITRTAVTEVEGKNLISFTFNDGSQMNVVGVFEVRYKAPGAVPGIGEMTIWPEGVSELNSSPAGSESEK